MVGMKTSIHSGPSGPSLRTPDLSELVLSVFYSIFQYYSNMKKIIIFDVRYWHLINLLLFFTSHDKQTVLERIPPRHFVYLTSYQVKMMVSSL